MSKPQFLPPKMFSPVAEGDIQHGSPMGASKTASGQSDAQPLKSSGQEGSRERQAPNLTSEKSRGEKQPFPAPRGRLRPMSIPCSW